LLRCFSAQIEQSLLTNFHCFLNLLNFDRKTAQQTKTIDFPEKASFVTHVALKLTIIVAE